MATKVKLVADGVVTADQLTLTTAASGTNTTAPATTAFVQQEVAALVDSAPGTLNTLNELAAALGDDANFSTTVTNSIATKLPLAGGTMTGTLTLADIASSGYLQLTANDVDFIVRDTTDSPTNFIWRDHSGSKLYLGSPAAEVTIRSDAIIDTGYKIGIGESSPDALLHLSGGSAEKIIIEHSTAPRGNYIGISSSDNLEIAADEDNLGGDSSIRFRVDADEKMRIRHDGKVDIGNSTALYGKLTVTQSSGADTDEGGIGIVDSTNGRSMRLYCSSTTSFINSGNGGGQNLVLNEGGGNVGMGDSSPNVKLVVSEASGDTALAINDDRSNVSDYSRIDFRHNNITGSQIKSQALEDFSVDANRTSDLSFHTRNNGTIIDAMHIQEDGNVGIGGAPDSSGRLLVQNGGTNQIVLTNNDSATTNLNMGNFSGGGYISQNYYYDSGHQADDNTKGAYEIFIGDDAYGINYHSAGAMGTRRRDFAITSAGNTGIGTNSPSQFLDVRGHTSIGDGGGAVLLNFNSTGNAQLKLNNVEKLRIDNYGQVTLYGDGAGHGYLVPQDQGLGYTNNLNAGAFGILHRGSYDSYVTGNAYYYRTGGSSGWRAKYGAYKSTVMGMVNGAFTFDCSSAAPGSNGASVSGLASRVRIDSDGLKFGSDTASANALDDYEEGTWTPTSAATFSTAVGTYTKIGNQVTVHYHVVTTGGLPTSTSVVRIQNLPFTSASNFVGAAPIYSRFYTPNDSTLTSIIFDGDNFIRLININEQNFDYTIWGELEASANNSVYIIGTATYQV